MKKIKYGPDCISIITTYRCTAECRECCFDCGPHSIGRISNLDIRKAIDESLKMKSVKFIVWTGGECTLLGDDLVKGIEYARKKGLPSRIVSNGWWAQSEKSAVRRLKPMIDAGLVELNISTGDNHQEFIKPDTAIRAAVTGAKLGISSVISIEKTENSNFTLESLLKNKVYKQFIDQGKNIDKLEVINPVWVSFHKDTKYNYTYSELNNPDLKKGCNNIYTFIGVNPSGNIIGCCGLTMRYIPSMNLGNLKDVTMEEGYYSQYEDFIKKWIFTEGALNILIKAHEWDNSIEIPKFPHNCLYCAYIYNDEKVQKAIVENYDSVKDKVENEFNSKISWFKQKADNGMYQTN